MKKNIYLLKNLKGDSNAYKHNKPNYEIFI